MEEDSLQLETGLPDTTRAEIDEMRGRSVEIGIDGAIVNVKTAGAVKGSIVSVIGRRNELVIDSDTMMQ
jgi:hypothetical protein